MKPPKVLALFTGFAIAVPLEIRSTTEIDPGTIGWTIPGIISNSAVPQGEVDSPTPKNSLQRRVGPDPKFPVITASEAASRTGEGFSKTGWFFRGDPRTPEVIFSQGFQPQGNNMDLGEHLNFRPGSGFVAVSRSSQQAAAYAFGRTGQQTTTGYIYVIAPNNVPDGHFIPDFRQDTAVMRNKEFAVAGPIPPESISAVWEIGKNSGAKASWRSNSNAVVPWKNNKPCSIMKRDLCGVEDEPKKANDEERGKKKGEAKETKEAKEANKNQVDNKNQEPAAEPNKPAAKPNKFRARLGDAQRLLDGVWFDVAGESAYTNVFKRCVGPIQCFNCQEMGHKAFSCKKPQRCGRCAKAEHHHRECKETVLKCVPCGRPHESYSRNCRARNPGDETQAASGPSG
ncbi:hypothetical protein HRG_002005 [Hirsutella rhossiliensis]|uniref:CCHC-type domain-containing protein n=1 Tax=Hirsutella rhossiliensis TaxID=111463 RepID=A0A9P8N5Z4_9HYPO|nr:uncharacterized protein HRG_02005 [Hirsutella rhossiliensis]KAH0966596.1 hypothetical protein HRG_02005 [Hirsutella rhossiliensis]